ncbi:aminotransferase class I/II-fold pyridoxal phosphate-dependent enzyme [Hornefia butyriciproducens]|uniref:aminotransferase class I/II-fold pyridoxal phosphate-dependent enzyme n=1 Tax=Hornefia butyriciproducens TaxID=2652293 RepID=UPI002A919E4D|nr:aminotransferase class I/II-fold pyridoxal phosphate-dependent enzyme [Hornefia butyriciproducens]MDY5463082.1 aminotransferase class I/II-fold pyridoxal phosphate-dependent enzyme [Hornefia butyriciproducens]
MIKNPYIAKRHWEFKDAALSKTNEMVKRYNDVIDLSIGAPDYPADRKCIDRMYEDALRGHTKYTEFLGDEELRRATIQQYKEDYGYDFTMDEIIITAGGTHGLYLVMESILDEGDEVLAIAPFYIYYKPQVELPHGKLVIYNTRPEDNFDINVDELEKHITSRTKAIIVNSPCNPSGKVYSEENIRAILELAEKYDFLVIADDIYGALNYTNNKKKVFAYESSPKRVITVYSYSKDYSMTGLRLGHVIASRELIETMRRVNEAVTFTINAPAQRLGICAIENRREIQRGIYDEYYKRAKFVYEKVSCMNHIHCNKPEGTFYLFMDIRETGLTSEEIWERILDEAHVLILPGSGFGNAGEGFIRIACTVGVQELGAAFDRMAKMDIFK